MKNILIALVGIFAVIGTIVTLFFILNVFSGNNTDGIIVNRESEDSSKAVLALKYNLPEKIHGTDNVLLEIGYDTYGPKFSSSSDYSNRVANVVIHNLKTDISKLLFNSPIEISSIDYPKGSENSQEYIFYSCRISDTNSDGVINYKDNDVLFFSDLNGDSLTQISPDSLFTVNYKLFKEENLLAFLVTQNDEDSKNYRDQKLLWYNLTKREITNTDTLDKLLINSKKIFHINN